LFCFLSVELFWGKLVLKHEFLMFSGGRSVKQEYVVSILQFVAISTTLPHLNPPLTMGRKLDEQYFK